MRKVLISLVAAGAFLASAAPAAAQYQRAPTPPRAGYGYNGWGEVRGLHARLDRIRQQISRLDRRDAIRDHAADRLMHDANQIDRRLRNKTRNGLDPREAGDIQYRIQRLEQRVHWAVQGNWSRLRDGR